MLPSARNSPSGRTSGVSARPRADSCRWEQVNHQELSRVIAQRPQACSLARLLLAFTPHLSAMDHVQELSTETAQRRAYGLGDAIFMSAVRDAPIKKLILVLGNGCHYSPDTPLRNTLIANDFHRRDYFESVLPRDLTATERDQHVFRLYETCRIQGLRMLPAATFAYVAYLALHGYVRSVITPNYDVVLDSTLAKIDCPTAINPDLGKPLAPDYGDSPPEPLLRVWKYHGDCRFIRFSDCKTIFRLPPFACYPYADDMTKSQSKAFGRAVTAATKRDYSMPRIPLHDVVPAHHVCGTAKHFIDYSYPMTSKVELFGEEISASTVELLESSPANTAGILVLGFAGRYSASPDDRSHEEIVDPILHACRAGVPTLMIWKPRPGRDDSAEWRDNYLGQQLLALPSGDVLLDDLVNAVALMLDVLPELAPAVGYQTHLKAINRFAT